MWGDSRGGNAFSKGNGNAIFQAKHEAKKSKFKLAVISPVRSFWNLIFLPVIILSTVFESGRDVTDEFIDYYYYLSTIHRSEC